MNARELALDLVLRWSRSRRLADELLEERLAGMALSGPERALTMELFYGWLRHRLALEFLQGQLASQAPRTPLGPILQLGLYQLHFLKMPAHAAVHETVALAKQHASRAETGFVNAVLRRWDQASLEGAPRWVALSHPEWLWQRWVAQWGAATTEQLCAWNNAPPPLYARRNLLLPDPGDAPLDKSDLHPLAYRVSAAGPFFGSAAWTQGAYNVQDPSTLVAVDLLDPQPGEAILDLCSAPGGKTTYIAQKMQNRGQVIATDSSSVRLGRVGENCRRLGVSIVATLACDGRTARRCLRAAQYDRVLVDAPCSNTGVLRRRPDLRWRLKAAEISQLAGLQLELLREAAHLTKPGGVLVYSTCSLERDENERVVEQLRADLPGWRLESLRRSFPPADGMDGAFVARLRNG